MKKVDSNFEPWKISLDERRRVFGDAKDRGEKVALYYVELPDSMTFRYRCYNAFQVTQDSDKWQAVYFFDEEREVIEKLLPKADLFVLGRQFGEEEAVRGLIKRAKKKKIPVVLDIDDLIFDEKFLRVVLNTISQTNIWEFWRGIFAETNKVAKQMNGFLVTNDFLGGKIEASFGKPYRVIRNSLNKEQLEASQVYLRVGVKGGNGFDIGYFSGSPTHVNDLAEALSEIAAFLGDYTDARLVVVGLMEFGEGMQRFLDNGQIKFVRMTDFRKLQRLMAEVDVNIAPLVINDFTNCKSELKFFEAAAVETTTIASPTYTFKKAIADGRNGFLAQPGEWYDKLEYLYKNPDENRKIAEVAREYVLGEYTGRKFMKEVERAYSYFAVR